MAIASHFLWNTFGQSFQKCLSGPKVFQYNRPWLAIDSAGFYDAPVIMSPGSSFLKRCHISVYTGTPRPLLSSINFVFASFLCVISTSARPLAHRITPSHGTAASHLFQCILYLCSFKTCNTLILLANLSNISPQRPNS